MDTAGEEVIESETRLSVEPIEESASESIEDNIEGDVGEEVANPQSLLGDLDLTDRLSGAQNEEGVLDIPAFLRRQAN